MSPGTLDRVGTLYKNTPTAGVGGTPVDSLTVVVQDLWCRFVTISARQIITGARDASETETAFVCRWFQGMEVGLLFDLEGIRYKITRCDQIGRREQWQFYGKATT